MATARENLPPRIMQRVGRELRQLVLQPLDGIRYVPQEEENLTEIHVEMEGPVNTPYDNGFFHVKIVLSDQFPHVPPKGFFKTKIFHPNIATNGDICVNTLKKDWKPDMGIAHVLQVIRCLMIVPFPESSLNDEAGKLFMESYDEYARRARLWTSIHAAKESVVKKTRQEQQQQEHNEDANAKRSSDPTSENSRSNNQVDQVADDTTSSSSSSTAKKRMSTSSGNSPMSLLKKKTTTASTTKRKGIRRL